MLPIFDFPSFLLEGMFAKVFNNGFWRFLSRGAPTRISPFLFPHLASQLSFQQLCIFPPFYFLVLVSFLLFSHIWFVLFGDISKCTPVFFQHVFTHFSETVFLWFFPPSTLFLAFFYPVSSVSPCIVSPQKSSFCEIKETRIFLTVSTGVFWYPRCFISLAHRTMKLRGKHSKPKIELNWNVSWALHYKDCGHTKFVNISKFSRTFPIMGLHVLPPYRCAETSHRNDQSSFNSGGASWLEYMVPNTKIRKIEKNFTGAQFFCGVQSWVKLLLKDWMKLQTENCSQSCLSLWIPRNPVFSPRPFALTFAPQFVCLTPTRAFLHVGWGL